MSRIQFENEIDILLQIISPTNETNQNRRLFFYFNYITFLLTLLIFLTFFSNLSLNLFSSAIISYIQNIFYNFSSDCKVVMGGSFPLRVYLPESDLDVVILTKTTDNDKDDLKEILNIFSCLCRAINEADKFGTLLNNNFEVPFHLQSFQISLFSQSLTQSLTILLFLFRI